MQEDQVNTSTESLNEVDFLWNDVAAINDENCAFIISKAMLCLPTDKADAANAEDAEIIDIVGEFAQGELKGEIILNLKYTDVGNEECALNLAVPFAVDYPKELSRGSVLEENYSSAQLADCRHILLETVISVPKKNMPLRRAPKIGHFERKSIITLPADWPQAERIIGTNLRYDPGSFRAENTQPLMEMSGHIGIIYEKQGDCGEKILYYEQEEPFTLALEEPLLEAEAAYYSLSAQLVNEKEISVQSFNYLFGEKSEISADLAEQAPAAELKKEEIAEKCSAEIEDTAFQSAEEDLAKIPSCQKNQQPKTARPNRRESLEKHMHRLDRGVKTSHIVRNIEFNK